MKPSVGRIVHYVSYGTPDGEYPSVCRAAIITEIPEVVGQTENRDPVGVVGLCVLTPTGMFFDREVWHLENNHQGGTWHWPERVED